MSMTDNIPSSFKSTTKSYTSPETNEQSPQPNASKQLHQIKDFYSIKKNQLEGRHVLGHINPITLQFVSLTLADGSHYYSPNQLQDFLSQKVLFAFIDEENLEKMMILSTLAEDTIKVQILTEQRLILGSIDTKTNRFVPDVLPGPGFYDWESYF